MPDDATITPDAPEQDTGIDAGSTSVDTQTPAAPEQQDATQVADPGTVQSTTAPSTTTQQANQTDPEPKPEPAVDWQNRYRDLQSYADRRHQGYQQHLSKLQAELQQMREAQEKAQLRPFQKSHPDHQKFRGLLERSKAIHRQLQATEKMPEEQRLAAQSAIMAGVSPEEQQTLTEYRESLQNFQNDFFADPEATMAPLMERVVQQAMGKAFADMRGKQQVEQDFSAPHLQPILQDPKYAGYLNEKLARGVPYEDAMEALKLRAAADLMYAKLNGANRQVTHAQEQQRLLRKRASGPVSSDPAETPVDPYKLALKEAAKLGIQPGTAQFNKLIDRFSNGQGT